MTDTETNVTQLRPVKDRTAAERARRFRRKKRKGTVTRRVTPPVTVPVTPPSTPTVTPAAPKTVTPTVTEPLRVTAENAPQDEAVTPIARHSAHVSSVTFIDALAYTAAIGLASVAALFSIKGMVQLFPGTPVLIVGMAITMETAKLVTAGWLASRWRVTAWIWRLTLVALVTGLAVINGVGVFSQLVASHLGERGTAQSAIETQDAALAARIDVQAHAVADLDRRLSQIDSAIEEAAKRGRTNTALSAIDGQKKARASLVDERRREASTLADLKTERAALAAKGRQIETEAAPIRYVAELIGADTDSERAIRWLILMMVLCCDPLAIALTAAASARGDADDISQQFRLKPG